MRDHRRILGALFIAWAVLQIAFAITLAITRRGQPIPYPTLYWISTALLALAYAWTGWRLRLHDARVRVLAILLSAFALISFPVGTLLGIYGLWALLRRPAKQVSAQ